jgi:hypothetical protein
MPDINYLFSEIQKIDEMYIKIDSDSKQTKDFYKLIENNTLFLEKSFTSIKIYISKKPYFNFYLKHIASHLPYINYKNFVCIKNDIDYSIIILLLALL